MPSSALSPRGACGPGLARSRRRPSSRGSSRPPRRRPRRCAPPARPVRMRTSRPAWSRALRRRDVARRLRADSHGKRAPARPSVRAARRAASQPCGGGTRASRARPAGGWRRGRAGRRRRCPRRRGPRSAEPVSPRAPTAASPLDAADAMRWKSAKRMASVSSLSPGTETSAVSHRRAHAARWRASRRSQPSRSASARRLARLVAGRDAVRIADVDARAGRGRRPPAAPASQRRRRHRAPPERGRTPNRRHRAPAPGPERTGPRRWRFGPCARSATVPGRSSDENCTERTTPVRGVRDLLADEPGPQRERSAHMRASAEGAP